MSDNITIEPATRADRSLALKWAVEELGWNQNPGDYDVWSKCIQPEQILAAKDKNGRRIANI